MKHEKVFKREDGSKIRIGVSLYSNGFSDEIDWKFWVHTCAPGKRSWYGTFNTDDYSYRKLTLDERKKHEIESALKYATLDEIKEVKTELWMKLKPDNP